MLDSSLSQPFRLLWFVLLTMKCTGPGFYCGEEKIFIFSPARAAAVRLDLTITVTITFFYDFYYFDNYPMLLTMPPEQRGLLFTALMQYADGRWRGEVTDPEEVLVRWPDMGAQAQMGFRFMASAVDRDTQRWLLRRQAGERRRQQTREGERGAPAPSSPAPRARTEPPDARYSADLEQTRRLVERIRSGGA